MQRRYEQCRVCRKKWNVSIALKVNEGAYKCPRCLARERSKKKKKKEALRCGNSTKPQGDKCRPVIASIITAMED